VTGRELGDGGTAGRAPAPAGEKEPGRSARGVTVLATTACLGAAMVVLPALGLSGRGQLLTVAGLLLVAAGLAGPLARRPLTSTLAAVAAVAGSALGRSGTATLTAEGLLILGYLLLTDAPAAMPARVAARWLRQQAPAAVWAALASAVVLVVLAVPVPVSAWLVVTGAGAAVAAAVVALPRQPRQPR
jgi:hypothetical protein